jgi:hypothetical protein
MNAKQKNSSMKTKKKEKYVAVQDPMVKTWDRLRFRANLNDSRPVKWPPIGPYWCSGFNEDHSIMVAYFPHGTSDKIIKEYWPEASGIERMQENVPLSFSDRFPKPKWWIANEAK